MKRGYDYDHLIDGDPMLNPDGGVEIRYQDLQFGDSGLDESGVMHRIVIRHDVRSWVFSYALLTAEEFGYLRSLFRKKTQFIFTHIGETGEKESVTAYCTGCSIAYQSKRSGLYKNLKLEILEC